MRRFAAIGALLLLLALAGCGSDDAAQVESASSSAPAPMLSMSKAEIAKLPQYSIKAYSGPVPKKLVIRDLWKGTGAKITKIRPSDKIYVGYAGAHWGEALHTTPATRNPLSEFSMGEVVETWKKGLPGMRVGGRRELIAPHSIGYENGTYVYVIDLLAIKRR